MKVHLPGQKGQIHFGLREIKTIQDGIRLKASNIHISTNDNCYIDLNHDELRRIEEF